MSEPARYALEYLFAFAGTLLVWVLLEAYAMFRKPALRAFHKIFYGKSR